MRVDAVRAATAVALLLLCAAVVATPLRTVVGRVEANVASFKDLREAHLVRQGWDTSCGAAALSTVLSFHYQDPYTESTIALSILANTDPDRVRERGGFSLLDLKRFAEAVGYRADGYAGLSLDDLAASAVPAILPVRIRGYDHFVVFRGRAGNRVLIGDPAFGNLTMHISEFADAWTSGIGFFVFDDADGARDAIASPLDPNAMNLPLPNLHYIQRLSRGGGPVPATIRTPPLSLP